MCGGDTWAVELRDAPAAEEGANLIVMGTHGRGGVARFFLGSVADRVIRTASCPVVTVRTPERG